MTDEQKAKRKMILKAVKKSLKHSLKVALGNWDGIVACMRCEYCPIKQCSGTRQCRDVLKEWYYDADSD